MFDFVRQHTKIMMFVLFLLVIPSFVLFGIDGYSNSNDKGAVVARVGGDEIKQSELDAAHKIESDRLRNSVPNIDVKLLDSAEARYATLENLVRERVLRKAATEFRLTTSDARLARDLQENPTIASLRLPDGKLDMDRYRQLAASQGLTPEGFEARVRQDLSLRQVEAGVVSTGFSAKKIADVSLNAFFEKREVQVATFATVDYASKVKPAESDLKAFYEANPAMFQAAEQANIEYITLDLESIKKSISLNESDLKSYYEQNVARFSGAEERRASHILITAAKDAPVAEREAAKARAGELMAQAKKSPDTFGELAKKNSQDTGSASNGGDLDFFARGAMVKPFEDAAFLLKKGEISDVVESDFGFHIIKLTDVKAPKQRSFEEMRPAMESDLKNQQAQSKFAELAEAFANGVYEQSDSLKPVADKLKLEIKIASGVTRTPANGAVGVLTNGKFLAALFASDAIEKKHNTEAVETAPNQLTAGRVTQYSAAQTQPFSAVQSSVRERLIASKAAELAQKEGKEKLAAWQNAPNSSPMPAAKVISRDQAQNVELPVLVAALRATTESLPAFVGVDLGSRGYAVVRVNKVVANETKPEASVTQDRAQYGQWWSAAEGQAYYAFLKNHFKTEILIPKPNRTVKESIASANTQ
ncbi:SurA N-terminal domain-containing protein [Rhodoferax sp. PAMC 29310]|uniref:SurA N-terminal domain-containing protein n=1 Tax=Rhodoferax sp. PAMC 29310 TaxID=2822760 RepID=UPI001B31CB8B|nr:SurA N-terminal domain-containing protein [Rhodoferax sp. PAMC 29310]